MTNKITNRGSSIIIGYWSAFLTLVTVGLFCILLAVSLFGPQTIYFSFVVVMVMSLGFIGLQAAIFSDVDNNRKVYAVLSLVAVTMFSVFISIAYYTQLTLVRLNPLGLSDEIIKLIKYTPGSISFSLDMLGFSFLCLSALFLVPIFKGQENKVLRTFLWINGLLAVPTFVFPIFFVAPGIASSDMFGSIAILIWGLVFLPVPGLIFLKIKRQERLF